MILDDRAAMALVESAYDGRLNDEEWHQSMLAGLRRVAGTARGGAWFSFQLAPVEGGLKFDTMGALELMGDDFLARDLEEAHPILTPTLVAAMYGRTRGGTASDISGLGVKLPTLPAWHDGWTSTVNDALGVCLREPDGSGAMVVVGLSNVTKLNEAQQRSLNRLATHSAAGLRLRRCSVTVDTAQAVFSHDGVLLHAAPSAVGKRAAIDESRQRRDYARKNSDDATLALDPAKKKRRA